MEKSNCTRIEFKVVTEECHSMQEKTVRHLYLFEIEIRYNNTNVFNASLLNESGNFFKTKKNLPQTFNIKQNYLLI